MSDKTEFYVEFWKLGDPPNVIQQDTFHLDRGHLKAFIKTFMGYGFTIVYLAIAGEGGKVIWDRRQPIR